jgi:hypothetical protein
MEVHGFSNRGSALSTWLGLAIIIGGGVVIQFGQA